jgi:hypothetical protein
MKPAIASDHGDAHVRALPAKAQVERRAPRSIHEEPSSTHEEPRTGVVRKVETPSASPARRRRDVSASGIVARRPAPSAASEQLDLAKSRAWRCLEWAAAHGPAPSEPAAPSVSIAQVSIDGRVLRQSGPNETLPETAEFVHRVSTLIAQGLGFGHCRALCLRGPAGALSVTEAGPSKIVSVSGPLRQMTNVLRRMDLE